MSRFVGSRNNKIDRLMSVPVPVYRDCSPAAGTFIPRKWAVLSQQQQDETERWMLMVRKPLDRYGEWTLNSLLHTSERLKMLED